MRIFFFFGERRSSEIRLKTTFCYDRDKISPRSDKTFAPEMTYSTKSRRSFEQSISYLGHGDRQIIPGSRRCANVPCRKIRKNIGILNPRAVSDRRKILPTGSTLVCRRGALHTRPSFAALISRLSKPSRPLLSPFFAEFRGFPALCTFSSPSSFFPLIPFSLTLFLSVFFYFSFLFSPTSSASRALSRVRTALRVGK